MINRRELLLLAATTSVGGCLERDENGEGSTLAWVVVSNHHDDSHAVDLEIEWEGETVLEETYQLPAHDSSGESVPGELADRVWPDEPGRFAVSARHSGGEWSTVDPADSEYPECYAVYVMVNEFSGNVVLAVVTDEESCSDAEIERMEAEATNGSVSDRTAV